jgi:hypothetical protein
VLKSRTFTARLVYIPHSRISLDKRTQLGCVVCRIWNSRPELVLGTTSFAGVNTSRHGQMVTSTNAFHTRQAMPDQDLCMQWQPDSTLITDCPARKLGHIHDLNVCLQYWTLKFIWRNLYGGLRPPEVDIKIYLTKPTRSCQTYMVAYGHQKWTSKFISPNLREVDIKIYLTKPTRSIYIYIYVYIYIYGGLRPPEVDIKIYLTKPTRSGHQNLSHQTYEILPEVDIKIYLTKPTRSCQKWTSKFISPNLRDLGSGQDRSWWDFKCHYLQTKQKPLDSDYIIHPSLRDG